jgi:hypothetical protein
MFRELQQLHMLTVIAVELGVVILLQVASLLRGKR